MDVDFRSRRRRRWVPLGASLLLAGLACLRPKPTGDNAPRPAPVSEPTAAPEAPEPLESAPPPPPAAADSANEAAAPASGRGSPAGGVGAAAPQAKPIPAESESKSRKAAPRKAGSALAIEPEGSLQPAGELRRRLDRAYAASTPDCPAARDRKKAVCDLATQICALTDRDPNVASVAEYCEEARRRCNDAERRTSERCPE